MERKASDYFGVAKLNKTSTGSLSIRKIFDIDKLETFIDPPQDDETVALFYVRKYKTIELSNSNVTIVKK